MKLVNKPLTEKQIKFSHLYVIEGGLKSNTEIAIEAGYSKDSSYQRAYELLNEKICPHVVKYIREIQKDVDKKFDINEDSHLKKLWEIQSKAEQKGMLGVALRAEELRGKTKGLYVDYSKNMNINKNGLDDLTTEELEARMKGTLEHYSKISTVKEEEYDKDKHSKADD
tara:strand:+ start:3371 stop:3877 length:507 start_codon:yes stop_codon:yes gene_type:complete